MMSRKNRIATTPFEQMIFASLIHRFFAAEERSVERGEVVKQAMESVRPSGRKWTARSIRLWFNNNKKHYLNDVQVNEPGIGPAPMMSYGNASMTPIPVGPRTFAYELIPVQLRPVNAPFERALIFGAEYGLKMPFPEPGEIMEPLPILQPIVPILQFNPLIYGDGVRNTLSLE
jgi:hypothetical protein